MTDANTSLGKIAAQGILWSILQNWGGRLFTFLLFVILARFLTPEDYGLASAAGLFLMVVSLIAEFGFGDAIVQRRDLKPQDINLPFYVCLSIALVLCAGIIVFSKPIEQWMDIPGFSPFLVAAAVAIPINTFAMFQEFMYKRELNFKFLALRTFTANIVGGGAAVISAFLGFGVWSFIIQGYIGTVINLVWLWRRPRWRPSMILDAASFWQLNRFGMNVLSQRIVDLIATRAVEVLILGRYGVAVYGLYTVGARLYQTMMQLLQGALYDVSLSVLSTISQDRDRLRQVFLKSIGISAYLATPIFVVVAALTPEVCAVLFGSKWLGVDAVARPLLLLGALQCVQFLNGPYLSARGRPSLVTIGGSSKAVATVLLLLLVPTDNVEQLALVFAVGQLAATPLMYFFISRELDLPLRQILKVLAPAAISCALGFIGVVFARHILVPYDFGAFLQGLCLGCVFLVIYLIAVCVFDRHRAGAFINFAKNQAKARLAARRHSA